jgi:hypothetical protein
MRIACAGSAARTSRAVRSTGTESDDNDDGDDEINDGTYVDPSEKVMDANNVLQQLHHARSEDKVMWGWTGVMALYSYAQLPM